MNIDCHCSLHLIFASLFSEMMSEEHLNEENSFINVKLFDSKFEGEGE